MGIKIARLLATAARRVLSLVRRIGQGVVLTLVAIIVGFTTYAVSMLPDLQPWHTERLPGEFTRQDRELDFDGYLKLEATLFEQLQTAIADWDHSSEAFAYSRFNPASPVNQLAPGKPYNRSFRLTSPQPKGHALLIHGLTDSPYSMKAMAESLYAQGFDVTVLRLPGHGTLPSMLTEMSKRDWTAAVRLAAKDVASRTLAGQPFYIGGHSTGGTLAMQYTLDALSDNSLRLPDRVLLLSPAIDLADVAVLAGIVDVLSIVPIPVLEKARWQEITAEYDPYKFNSFPVNAARQVNRAARELRSSLQDASESGQISRLPPVVTWQSVVDSTVGSDGVAKLLYPALKSPVHRLVLFDVNRNKGLGTLQRPAARTLLESLVTNARDYTLDIVADVDSTTTAIQVTRHAPDGSQTIFATDLAWPDNLVSVGHLSLPFPPDDPVYGFIPGSGQHGIASLGSRLLRGENGAISISLGSFTRLRSNPFWSLIEADLGTMVAADLAPTGQ